MHPLSNPQVSGLLFDAAGILILGVPAVFRMSREIQAQAGTYWDANPHLARALSESRVDITVGSLVLLAGFLMQLAGNLGYVYVRCFGLSLNVGAVVFVFAYFLYLRRRLYGVLFNHVMAALDRARQSESNG